MINTVSARRTMVENQLRPSDVTDFAVLSAFEAVPREAFVRPAEVAIAYLDRELVALDGRTQLLMPMVLARMVQALEISPGDRVLDVGGAGYSAAILRTLGADVTALDTDKVSVETALAASGIAGVEAVSGPLAEGVSARAPFNAILVNGVADSAPEALIRQLAEGGRLIVVIGQGRSGRVTLFRKFGGTVSPSIVFDAAAPNIAAFRAVSAFQF